MMISRFLFVAWGKPSDESSLEAIVTLSNTARQAIAIDVSCITKTLSSPRAELNERGRNNSAHLHAVDQTTVDVDGRATAFDEMTKQRRNVGHLGTVPRPF